MYNNQLIRAYRDISHEQLLNLNNLYLICYNCNRQMNENFQSLLYSNSLQNNQSNNANSWRVNEPRRHFRSNNTNDNYNVVWNERTGRYQHPSIPLNNSNNLWQHPPPPPPPPPPPSQPPPTFSNTPNTSGPLFNNTNVNRNLHFPTRRTGYWNNRNRNRNRNTRMSRRTTFQPFFFGSTTQNILNDSLYDSSPNNPLSTADFLRETSRDTWHNTRLLLDMPVLSRCAITQEQFNDDDIVSRICHCGHVFNHTALLRWFQRDTRCPICRYDLRTNRNNSQQDNSSNQVSGEINFETNNSNQSNNEETKEEETRNESKNNDTPPLSWRSPLVSPVNNSSSTNSSNISSDILNSLANEIEANISNTLLDNSQNFISLSTQVANNLFDAVSNNFGNSNIADFMTTEFSFQIPPNSNLTTSSVFGNNTNIPENSTDIYSQSNINDISPNVTDDIMD